MLFSGLGSIEKAQETLSVGVGALAGSTIMLMTIPWFISVFAGRVNMDGPNKTPNYFGRPKLSSRSLTKTGVVRFAVPVLAVPAGSVHEIDAIKSLTPSDSTEMV